MTMKSYKNQTVKVEDPQGRFMDGMEFKNTTVQYDKEKSEWHISIPEIQPKVEKPKPTSLYENTDTNIKVTRRVDGKIQMTWMIIDTERVVKLGIKEVRKAVKAALDVVWENVK